MANFRLPGPLCTVLRLSGPLCTVLGRLEADAGTLSRSASPIPGPVGPQATPPPLAPTLQKESPAATAATPVVKLTDTDFRMAAATLGPGVSVAIIRAFAEVESGGKSGFGPAGKPIIAYEGHTFRKLTNHAHDEQYPLLSYKYVTKAGPEWKLNNKDQETAWKTLAQAMALDRSAALQSCSWGMFQVMGFNFRDCGYSSIDDFVAAMSAGERGQLDAFVGYCRKKPGMVEALKANNFVAMATLYNGKDFGDYDKKIARAYKKYGGT